MPFCDGFECTKRIRKHEKLQRKSHDSTGPRLRAFIVALTGQGSSSEKEQALACGMDHFIMKPMLLSDLKAFFAKWERAKV